MDFAHIEQLLTLLNVVKQHEQQQVVAASQAQQTPTSPQPGSVGASSGV